MVLVTSKAWVSKKISIFAQRNKKEKRWNEKTRKPCLFNCSTFGIRRLRRWHICKAAAAFGQYSLPSSVPPSIASRSWSSNRTQPSASVRHYSLTTPCWTSLLRRRTSSTDWTTTSSTPKTMHGAGVCTEKPSWRREDWETDCSLLSVPTQTIWMSMSMQERQKNALPIFFGHSKTTASKPVCVPVVDMSEGNHSLFK